MSKEITEKNAISILNSARPRKGSYDRLQSAFDMAIKALKKQIPKQPYYSGDGYWNGELVYDTWECPNCSKSYEVDYDDFDYCPNCGQKIDWSKSNE